MANSYISCFIKSLSIEEQKIVKAHLNKTMDGVESKIIQLLIALTKDPEKSITDAELARMLDINLVALRVLKSRLFKKTKEALLLDEYIENVTIFNERERIVFSLKKKILFIKLLSRKLNQNKVQTLILLIEEAIQEAKQNEVYDVLAETLIIKKQIMGMRMGIYEYETINKQIAIYNHCYRCVQNANDAYYKLILNQEFINSLTQHEITKHTRIQ